LLKDAQASPYGSSIARYAPDANAIVFYSDVNFK